MPKFSFYNIVLEYSNYFAPHKELPMKKRICAAALCLSLCTSMALSAAALDVETARELLAEHYISPLPAAAEQPRPWTSCFPL